MTSAGKTDIWVFAHWKGMLEPKCIGILSAHRAKGKKAFSFEYDKEWIGTEQQMLLDPDIGWYGGAQYPDAKENFGLFLDSMPDTWGKTLLKRKAAHDALKVGKPTRNLYDIDFLLGVFDESRMGAIRLKLDKNGPFLDNDQGHSVPPWSSLRELQQAVVSFEADNNKLGNKWLEMLIAPGTSLGGARPKANVLDEHGQLWIAKFPSKNDIVDKGAWEYLAYRLALKAGINMVECRSMQLAGHHHTFLTKRFDRDLQQRIHFASAMTMTGNTEETIKENPASYLHLAEFIQYNCTHSLSDLHQLWRRIVFNMAISNTDDHLRNHGFVLNNEGWQLSPAFDINPSDDKNGLALNVDTHNNALDFDLAKSVGQYFQLNNAQMETIIAEVSSAAKEWRTFAEQIGIPRAQQEMMSGAFIEV